MKTFDIIFTCIDFWGRAIFKLKDKQVYFGALDTIFPDTVKAPNGTPEEVVNYFKNNTHEIVLFGAEIDDDPDGRRSDKWEFNISL
jgi:hypothetical protein